VTSLVNRRKIASVLAVPSPIAVAYLIIEPYCGSMMSQRTGRVSAGCSSGQAPVSPFPGRYSFIWLICLNRAIRSKSSSLVMPNPMNEAPWEST
jgi:hypothetical protein